MTRRSTHVRAALGFALFAGSLLASPAEAATAPSPEAEPVPAVAAASRLPFNYWVSFDSTLRGRDMKTSSGNFCNRFRADAVENRAATPYILVTLVKNRVLWDDRLETRRLSTNGRVHRVCWPHHDGSATYHFEYRVPNVGYGVKGHGTVYRR